MGEKTIFIFLFAIIAKPYYIIAMTITQTLNVPASRRLTIDVPPEFPDGRITLTFSPAEAESGFAQDDAAEEDAPFLRLRGIFKGIPDTSVESGFAQDDAAEEDAPFLRLMGRYKGLPGASVDEFLARCREDKEYELALDRRRQEERAHYAKVPS